jgi:hypothetical protein
MGHGRWYINKREIVINKRERVHKHTGEDP